MHPLAASGANFETLSGPVLFQVRTPEAILRVPKGGLRIAADCTIDGPLADCRLHFGPLAM
eukprot:5264564-Alexandrium_andersonii.AAC.1